MLKILENTDILLLNKQVLILWEVTFDNIDSDIFMTMVTEFPSMHKSSMVHSSLWKFSADYAIFFGYNGMKFRQQGIKK